MRPRAATRRAVHGGMFRRSDPHRTAQRPINVAEADLRGGLSPRVTPMAEIRELGALLQRAGLALPVADSLKIPAAYSDIYHLMRDLRDMGETNIMTARPKTFTPKSLFDRAQEVFAAEFPSR